MKILPAQILNPKWNPIGLGMEPMLTQGYTAFQGHNWESGVTRMEAITKLLNKLDWSERDQQDWVMNHFV